MTPAQGEVWWAELPEAGRRPVMVITRDQAIPVLRTVLVAPVTRTVRGIPTEIALGPEDGLPEVCAATFDNLQPVPRSLLVDRAGPSGPSRRIDICQRLRNLADC